jgi:predicted NAD-dependent protein-ADP-ribosyltransferase YbiA (DUF1768 family)
MSDKKILEKGVMNFFFKKEECRSLSNFWKCLVVIHDENGECREYDSGESCFHGEKFIAVSRFTHDENRKKMLLDYAKKFLKIVCEKEGSVVKKMGRQFTLSKEELDIWQNESIYVQMKICKYKLENYEEVMIDLNKSKSKILIHPAMRCSEEKVRTRLWEGKGIIVDGKIEVIGQNMLGNLWMELREKC